MAEADLVLVVVDGTAQLHIEDAKTIAAIADRPMLVAANKLDLGTVEIALDRQRSIVRTSATTGEGIGELRQSILALVTKGAPAQETALVTNLRQRQAVSDALASLDKASEAVVATIPHEMLLLDLYESLSALDRLTGATTADDILHLIFSTFCIGK
jgi:tRNA modification GTPase